MADFEPYFMACGMTLLMRAVQKREGGARGWLLRICREPGCLREGSKNARPSGAQI